MKINDIITVRKSVPSLSGQRGMILGFTHGGTYYGKYSPKAVVHLFDDPTGKKYRYLKAHNLKKHKMPDYNQQNGIYSLGQITSSSRKVKKNGNIKITYKYQDGSVARTEKILKRSF